MSIGLHLCLLCPRDAFLQLCMVLLQRALLGKQVCELDSCLRDMRTHFGQQILVEVNFIREEFMFVFAHVPVFTLEHVY